jgi:hypothetical protein
LWASSVDITSRRGQAFTPLNAQAGVYEVDDQAATPWVDVHRSYRGLLQPERPPCPHSLHSPQHTVPTVVSEVLPAIHPICRRGLGGGGFVLLRMPPDLLHRQLEHCGLDRLRCRLIPPLGHNGFVEGLGRRGWGEGRGGAGG